MEQIAEMHPLRLSKQKEKVFDQDSLCTSIKHILVR